MEQTGEQGATALVPIMITQQFRTQYFDFPELVGKFCHGYERELAARNLFLCTRLATGMPNIFLGDPQLLLQLLRELAAYSLLQEARGFVMIEMKAEAESEDRYRIQLLLIMSGGGISRAREKRIFLPVRENGRGEASRSNRSLGASLYLAREICRLYDGDLAVRNSPGFGSRFMVDFRLSCAGECFYRMIQNQNG